MTLRDDVLRCIFALGVDDDSSRSIANGCLMTWKRRPLFHFMLHVRLAFMMWRCNYAHHLAGCCWLLVVHVVMGASHSLVSPSSVGPTTTRWENHERGTRVSKSTSSGSSPPTTSPLQLRPTLVLHDEIHLVLQTLPGLVWHPFVLVLLS